MGSGAHRFRFFVDVVGTAGTAVQPAEADLRHLRVLRLRDGEPVEVVDAAGVCWQARVAGERLELVDPIANVHDQPATSIELVAGALTGARFDDLVDAAVQAGADRVVPLALTRRDLERLTSRTPRLRRIAKAAAQQSKRGLVPELGAPIDERELLALEPGIVLDAAAGIGLDERLEQTGGRELRLLVGPAEGLAPELVTGLLKRGWRDARLGPTILRAELAAAVAVAIAAMHASRT